MLQKGGSVAGKRTVLLTGATGYVGGRLLPLLEKRRYPVRCLTRRPDNLEGRVAPCTEVVGGDLLAPAALRPAMRGVDTAIYLVHALGTVAGFEREELDAARNFADAAAVAGVRRVIYLGGLGDDDADSPHLRTRHAVGEILRTSGVPTIEFRASIIIGSGSASFEMIRALVEKLPVMVTPNWVRNLAQPIGIEDVLAYLVEAMTSTASGVFEIGGPDRMAYGDLLKEYARQRGLRRIMIPVPVLTPKISSLWLGLVTPIYARIGRKLIDSIRHDTVVRDDRARSAFAVRPRGVADALARALVNEDREFAQTRWSDAVSASGSPPGWGGRVMGRRVVDTRSIAVAVSAARAFRPIERIGGEVGWYYADALWRLRGFIDLLVGGVGVRRGRRDPKRLSVGDTVDWWRVEATEPDRMVRLRAEMKVPGRAWLQFEVRESEASSTITQTAIFDPRGVSGWAYWYALYPLHALIFGGMLKRIGRSAERAAAPVGGHDDVAPH